MQTNYKVVISIDGAGGRGIVALKILSYLQKIVRRDNPDLDITDWVDLFAGSSTGSIISGALMMKNEDGRALHDPDDILTLYKYRGNQLFVRNPHIDPVNQTYPLGFVLEKFFGNTNLNMLDKHFIFTSYDLNSDSPFYFSDNQDLFRSLSLAKMMKACCAYPGVFPPLKIGSMLLADGILATVNPSMLAYDYARLFYPDDPIILISLGTGYNTDDSEDLIFKESKIVHEKMKKLTEKDDSLIYFRFQPRIVTASKDVNDASKENVEALLYDVEQYIIRHRQQFEELGQLLLAKADHMFI